MLVAFQGFTAPPGGKKTVAGMENVFVGEYKYEMKDSKEFRNKIDEKITRIAAAINNRESKRVGPVTFVNRVAYRFMPDQKSDRYFLVSSLCTGCLTCQKVCPVNNITPVAGKPEFRHSCEHCLACIHNCPNQAIEWEEKTKGKARYRNIGVSLVDLIAFNNQEDALNK
jgi:ferredoxin